MKRFLKIFVPVMMVIAILFSIGWYLIKYDPAFTQDMLISLARKSEDAGNLELAIWFYERAYEQSNNDDTVALELAEQFKAAGNYTKAEYTLSNAIADGGNMELYVALCQTYVEQDKLLDAVAMLDNVTDPAIKTQLDLMRPEAPAADPVPGVYNEYVSVSLSAGGDIYYSLDAEYPSVNTAAYRSPIALQAGKTVIQAVAVGENGLVSPLTVLTYELNNIVEDTVLADPAIDQVIRELLHVSEDHQLTTDQLWPITSLVIPSDATSLDDLSKFPYLTSLAITDSQITDLTPIASLTGLTELVISGTALSDRDLEAISQLTELTTLCLTGCSISSVTDLAGCTKLTYLDLSGNMIGNLSALSGMTGLTYLDLSNNAITSLKDLGGLDQLADLYLSSNSITTPAQLAGCTSLSTLDLSKNSLTTVFGLDKLTNLRSLLLSENDLTSISELAASTTLMELDISRNAITDIAALSALNQLFTLDFSYNQVSELPFFTENCALVTINGSHNQLKSLEELRVLDQLVQVNMDYNAELSEINILADCDSLQEVSVYGTAVKDVSALRDKGIKVTYSQV